MLRGKIVKYVLGISLMIATSLYFIWNAQFMHQGALLVIPGSSAIAILATGEAKDICDLHENIFTLGRALPSSTAPILIFHEGEINRTTRADLVGAAEKGGYKGPVEFHDVVFSLPKGCCNFEPNWSKGSKFGYHNMIKFWIKDVWHHPAIIKGRYESLMRLDTDSAVLEPQSDELPTIPPKVLYRGNSYTIDLCPVIDQFDIFLEKVLSSRIPKNPEIIERFRSMLKEDAVPTIYNNFFVAKVNFFQQKEVVNLVELICCTAPDYYIYRYRWGDAIIHLFLLAMEAKEDELLILPPVGYQHPSSFPRCSTFNATRTRHDVIEATIGS